MFHVGHAIEHGAILQHNTSCQIAFHLTVLRYPITSHAFSVLPNTMLDSAQFGSMSLDPARLDCTIHHPTLLYIQYSALSTQNSVINTQYSVLNSPCPALCCVPSVLCTLCSLLSTPLSTLYSLRSTRYALRSALYSLLSTLCSLPSTVFSLLSTPYPLLCTLYSAVLFASIQFQTMPDNAILCYARLACDLLCSALSFSTLLEAMVDDMLCALLYAVLCALCSVLCARCSAVPASSGSLWAHIA